MSKEYLGSLEPVRQSAARELMGMITKHYPSASFDVAPGMDDDTATHIWATVDVEDPDEVMDLIIDRLVALQVEEQLPISVIPIRTPERVAKLLQLQHRTRPRIPLPPALP